MADSPYPNLADVGFQRMLPSAALRPYVQWYWSVQSHGRVTSPREEFMHPDGSLGLVFNWGDALDFSDGSYTQTVTLDRASTHSRQLKLAGTVEAFGVLFQPGGAYPLFGVPLNELVDTAVLTDHLQSNQPHHLHDQLAKVPSFLEKVALIETWLKRRLEHLNSPSPVVTPSLAMIAQNHGQILMQTVAEAVYLSPRQLERLFKTQVGLSPKRFARVMRIRQTRDALKQLEAAHSLTQVAHDHGFFDQPHFIREFKSVVGMTPGAYLLRQQQKKS